MLLDNTDMDVQLLKLIRFISNNYVVTYLISRVRLRKSVILSLESVIYIF